jgi:hypothetical protein
MSNAIIMMCDACADDFLGRRPGKASELGFDYPGDPHIAIAHGGCAADFVANGFELERDICEDSDEFGLFCPHQPGGAASVLAGRLA